MISYLVLLLLSSLSSKVVVSIKLWWIWISFTCLKSELHRFSAACMAWPPKLLGRQHFQTDSKTFNAPFCASFLIWFHDKSIFLSADLKASSNRKISVFLKVATKILIFQKISLMILIKGIYLSIFLKSIYPY